MNIAFKKEFTVTSKFWSTYISTYSFFDQESQVGRLIFDDKAGQIQILGKEYDIKSKRKYFLLGSLEILHNHTTIGVVKIGGWLLQRSQLSYQGQSFSVMEEGRAEDFGLHKSRYLLKGDNQQVWYELQQKEIATNTWKYFEGKIQGKNFDLLLGILGLLHLETVVRSWDNSN